MTRRRFPFFRPVSHRGVRRYPCRNCVRGAGYFGALCPCKEFHVTNDAAILFTRKPNPRKWKKSSKKIRIRKRLVRRYRSWCLRFIHRQPFGRLALRHRRLRKRVRLPSRGGSRRLTFA